jgi:hypothetical protein
MPRGNAVTLFEILRAWLSALINRRARTQPPALPSYPSAAQLPMPINIADQISAEIARLNHYREAYGISHKVSLDVWRAGLSVDEVVQRVKQKAGLR